MHALLGKKSLYHMQHSTDWLILDTRVFRSDFVYIQIVYDVMDMLTASMSYREARLESTSAIYIFVFHLREQYFSLDFIVLNGVNSAMDVTRTKQDIFMPQETRDNPFDVTLVVEDGTEFRAHRKVLSEASSFFEFTISSPLSYGSPHSRLTPKRHDMIGFVGVKKWARKHYV